MAIVVTARPRLSDRAKPGSSRWVQANTDAHYPLSELFSFFDFSSTPRANFSL
jgi:hypothetical protein